jgi:hypothetical protein
VTNIVTVLSGTVSYPIPKKKEKKGRNGSIHVCKKFETIPSSKVQMYNKNSPMPKSDKKKKRKRYATNLQENNRQIHYG